jgi:hypothetical protein
LLGEESELSFAFFLDLCLRRLRFEASVIGGLKLSNPFL